MLARNSKKHLMKMIALAVVALLGSPIGRAIAAGADGQQEGIRVHGNWTIEIRDPDGTLVTRREFKNSLASGAEIGRAFLAHLLRGPIGDWEWGVMLEGSPMPCGSGTFAISCDIVPPNSTRSGTKALVVALTGSGEALELSGHATAVRASSIGSVRTQVWINSAGPPDLMVRGKTFTVKDLSTLSTPITVAEGQIIQVKVVISFS